jgi:hypothetical protein
MNNKNTNCRGNPLWLPDNLSPDFTTHLSGQVRTQDNTVYSLQFAVVRNCRGNPLWLPKSEPGFVKINPGSVLNTFIVQ